MASMSKLFLLCIIARLAQTFLIQPACRPACIQNAIQFKFPAQIYHSSTKLGSSEQDGLPPPEAKTAHMVLLNEDEAKRQSIKSKIFALSAATDRGFGANSEEAKRIKALVDELSKLSPVEDPSRGLYPNNFTAVDGSIGDCPIEGTWKLVFTTAFDVLSLSASPVTTLQGIYQVIARNGSSLNVIDLAPRIQSLLPPSLVGKGSTLRLKVSTEARARSSSRVGLTFLGFSASALTIANVDVPELFPSIGVSFPRLTLFGADNIGAASGSSRNSPGYFDVMYLDEECLIIKQNEPGGIFVNVKSDFPIALS